MNVKSNLNLKVHIIDIYLDRTTRVGYQLKGQPVVEGGQIEWKMV